MAAVASANRHSPCTALVGAMEALQRPDVFPHADERAGRNRMVAPSLWRARRATCFNPRGRPYLAGILAGRRGSMPVGLLPRSVVLAQLVVLSCAKAPTNHFHDLVWRGLRQNTMPSSLMVLSGHLLDRRVCFKKRDRSRSR